MAGLGKVRRGFTRERQTRCSRKWRESNSEKAPATVSRARRSWRRGGGEMPDWALPSRTRRR
jgi:hypothetical protein